MPCPVTIVAILFYEYFIRIAYRRAPKNYLRMDSSPPTRCDRERREEEEVVNRPDRRASGEFDAIVRVHILDLFRLHLCAQPSDYASLNAVARRIVAARSRPYVPASQASLFKILHSSQPDSLAELARREPASHANFQPNPLTPICPPILPSVLSAQAFTGSSAPRFSAPSELIPIYQSLPQTDAYAPPQTPQPNASFLAPTPQTVAVPASAYSVPPLTQIVSAPVLKFLSKLTAQTVPTRVLPFSSAVAVPAAPTPVAPFPSTLAVPPVPTPVVPSPFTVAVQAAPTTVTTIMFKETPTPTPCSRGSAIFEEDE